MSTGRWVSRAATGLLGCLALSALTLPAAHADDADPLRISINRISPSVLPRHGPLVVSGMVRNSDDVAWTQVALYPTLDDDACVANGTCPAPLTTSTELAEGAASDADTQVGERIVEESVKQEITSIAPNQKVRFTIRIPQSVLRQYVARPRAGVYWFGVQAIGQSETSPRDTIADGRARTFLPYVPVTGKTPVLDTAVVVPVRAPIQHERDGRLSNTAGWLEALSDGGALADELAIGRAAGGRSVTWLVDPAVVDAVQQLAAGNPGRLLPTPGASTSPSASPTGLGTGTSGSGSAGPLATAATTWLEEARSGFASGQLLSLPYGDPALLDSGATQQLYTWARAQTGVLSSWKIPAQRAIASPDGYLDPAGMTAAHDRAVALVGDQMLRRPVAGGTVGRHPFVATSTAAAAGGPDPEQPFNSVAVRQRILAEAAVRLLSGDTRPLVVQLPSGMGAGGANGFWTELDQPWLNLTNVATVLAQGTATVPPSTLTFPASHAADETQLDAQSEAQQLVLRGQLLQSILTAPKAKDGSESTAAANARMSAEITGEALAGTSYSLATALDSPARLAESRSWIDSQLAGVSISAPPSVTLSSSEGSFAVTLTNSLDVPVTVQVAADATGARIDKGDPVELAAHSRASVRLDAHTSRAGVHNLRLVVVNASGTPIGASVTVPIRSGSVGVVIWVILGTGAGILFFAIAVRLVRRIRRGRDRRAGATA
ncbi:MAG TPA: DUF6049 family protein [Nocardioides sp.]|nr:DUF6049 family protein [Nocardioides sp.]